MKKNIVGILVDDVNKTQALEMLKSFLVSKEQHTLFTPNGEICQMALKNPKFQQILNQGSLVVPDGQSVVMASKIIKNPLQEKVGGCDLIVSFLKSKTPMRIFLLGAKPEVVKRAKEQIEKNHPWIEIAGIQDGYFKSHQTQEIIQKINASKSDVLLVGLGAPKQEEWIHENLAQLEIAIAAGVGGTIDILSGVVERAPDFYIRHGLEWFFRLKKQPKRFFRMLNIPIFLCKAWMFRFKQ